MKKLLLLLLVCFMTCPCLIGKEFHYTFTINYEGNIPLTTPEKDSAEYPEKGIDIYQFIPSETKNTPSQSTFTLSVSETDVDFDIFLDTFFWSDLNERNEEGTYVSTSNELIYTKDTSYVTDLYLTKKYYIEDTAVFEIKRVKRTDDNILVYIFSFEQKLHGPNVTFEDIYGNKKSLPPHEYFKYMIDTFSDQWIHHTNDLRLELFNK